MITITDPCFGNRFTGKERQAWCAYLNQNDLSNRAYDNHIYYQGQAYKAMQRLNGRMRGNTQ